MKGLTGNKSRPCNEEDEAFVTPMKAVRHLKGRGGNSVSHI